MTQLALPALDGRKPLGFLAALGVLRLLTVHNGGSPRLSWSPDTASAVLDSDHASVNSVVQALTAIVGSIPEGGVLPGLPVDFPPPGEAPDHLRVSRAELAELAKTWLPKPDPETEAWLASLVTDLSVDDAKRSEISLMAAPSGKQSTRTMLQKPLELVRHQPSLLHEALVAWRRYPGVTGEYLDHQVLYDAADSGYGQSVERGVPGATWLALMSYPLLRTTASASERTTTGWHRGQTGPPVFIYPLWTAPLDCAAVVALLEHPLWEQAIEGGLPARAGALSVFSVHKAQRRRISGRTFAGVLAPVP